jgi:hypothetical protein
MLESEESDRATHDEVGQVIDRPRSEVEGGIAGTRWMPASSARRMFSTWMRLSGVSRGTRTSGRPSLSVTSAARSIRFEARPVTMPERVPIEQGATTMPSVRTEPDAIGAPMSAQRCWTRVPGAISLP